MSSSPGEQLWNGDEEVAAQTLEWRGDVFIAVGGALGEGDEDVASPFMGLET
jgi:hypothetical protein